MTGYLSNFLVLLQSQVDEIILSYGEDPRNYKMDIYGVVERVDKKDIPQELWNALVNFQIKLSI